jgi:hypothetical protein
MYKIIVDKEPTLTSAAKEFLALKGELHKVVSNDGVYEILSSLLKNHIASKFPELTHVEKSWVKPLNTLQGIFSTLVVEKEREVGFSTYALKKLYDKAAMVSGSTVAYVAPTHNVKALMVDRLLRYITHYGNVKVRGTHINKIWLDNGSLILLASPEPSGTLNSLKGYGFDEVICDEIVDTFVLEKQYHLYGAMKQGGTIMVAYSEEVFDYGTEQRDKLIKTIDSCGLTLIRLNNLG